MRSGAAISGATTSGATTTGTGAEATARRAEAKARERVRVPRRTPARRDTMAIARGQTSRTLCGHGAALGTLPKIISSAHFSGRCAGRILQPIRGHYGEQSGLRYRPASAPNSEWDHDMFSGPKQAAASTIFVHTD